MKAKFNLFALAVLAVLSIINYQLSTSFAQGTAFTYQGQLNSGSNPANGLYDLTFALFTDSGGVNQNGATLTNSAVGVTNGLFTTTLDFGPGIFYGESLWLEIGVETNGGGGSFTTLNPLQQLTPAPYAIYSAVANSATSAGVASSVGAGSVTGAGIASGSVVKSLNGLQDAVTLAPGANVSITPSGNTLTIASSAGGGGGTNSWSLTGNSGTSPTSGNFLGTTDNNPLELHVNGQTALRLEPNSGGVNVIGGSDNAVVSGNYGATIGGGFGNTNNAPDAFIGAGTFNQANGTSSVVGGGTGNQANGQDSVVGGGGNNIANGAGSVISGGGFNGTSFFENLANGNASTIGGGAGNEAVVDYTTISGGFGNTSGGEYAAVVGGYKNNSSGDYATVGGGYNNGASGTGAFVGGGGYDGTPGANLASGAASTVAGGINNQVNGTHGTVGGGFSNICGQAANATISGGDANSIAGTIAFFATIGGGWQNNISVAGLGAAIGGGVKNTNTGNYGTISGGNSNEVNAAYACVPGGYGNNANGQSSFAAGQIATANFNNSFVWGDGSNPAFDSGPNQFDVAATGGAYFYTSTSGTSISMDTSSDLDFGTTVRQMLNLYSLPGAMNNYGIGIQNQTLYFRCGNDVTGTGFAWYRGGSPNSNPFNNGGGQTLMVLTNGGLEVNGTFVSASDRNMKENFSAVDPRAVLEKVNALPIQNWNYKEDAGTRHIGPMAQDFYAAFRVGPDDKHITVVDEGGVALAAIQGLNQKLETENAELKQRLTTLEALVLKLAQEQK